MAANSVIQWTRDTLWRQGSVLCASAVDALGLRHSDPETTTIAVVISHDCDLATDNLQAEPYVELIVGKLVDALSGNFANGKSPRTLHLPLTCNGALAIVELVATEKRQLLKPDLAGFTPDGAYHLGGKFLAVLRSWLSARYLRSAFPDAFVQRMKDTKFDTKLAKLLEPDGDLVSHVFFDLDHGEVVERASGDAYDLAVVLVYAPGEDPLVSADKADALAESVSKLADDRLGVGKGISLRRCIAISEDGIPLSQARVMMQWRLEHMSFKSDEQVHPVAV